MQSRSCMLRNEPRVLAHYLENRSLKVYITGGLCVLRQNRRCSSMPSSMPLKHIKTRKPAFEIAITLHSHPCSGSWILRQRESHRHEPLPLKHQRVFQVVRQCSISMTTSAAKTSWTLRLLQFSVASSLTLSILLDDMVCSSH